MIDEIAHLIFLLFAMFPSAAFSLRLCLLLRKNHNPVRIECFQSNISSPPVLLALRSTATGAVTPVWTVASRTSGIGVSTATWPTNVENRLDSSVHTATTWRSTDRTSTRTSRARTGANRSTHWTSSRRRRSTEDRFCLWCTCIKKNGIIVIYSCIGYGIKSFIQTNWKFAISNTYTITAMIFSHFH